MQEENEGKELSTETAVLYEDAEVLVVNKPAGIMVHEDGRSEGHTLVDWFVDRIPEAKEVGEPGESPESKPLKRSGVVHRLDRDTSGVLVLAKTQDSFLHLKQQFHDRHVHKEYRAFVYGRMNQESGTIDRLIGRNANDFRKHSAERGAKGVLRDAVTYWETIGIGECEGESFSYVKLFPKTGRTHQLRVHLKAIDRPIIMDSLYAGKRVEQSNNLYMTRLALHAHGLKILLPSGEEKRFIASVPLDFEIAAERIVAGLDG